MSEAKVVVVQVVSGQPSVTAAVRAYVLSHNMSRLLKRYRQGDLDAIVRLPERLVEDGSTPPSHLATQ